MADLATLQSRLAEAETAYHNLMRGGQTEKVGHGDMMLTYTRAESAKLKSYIDELKGQIALAGGSVGGLRRRGLVVDL